MELRRIIIYLLTIIFVVGINLPIFIMILMSFRPEPIIFRGLDVLFSNQFTLEAYTKYFGLYNIWYYVLNTTFVSLSSTFICLLVGIPAAYAFSRFRFPAYSIFFILFLLVQLVPPIQVVIPMYVTFQTLGLLNTHLGLILALAVISLPFTVWLMTSYFSTVPRDIEEAAMVDGCGRIAVILKVLLPLIIPGVVASMIFTFTQAWGNFLVAYTLTSSSQTRMLTVEILLVLPAAGSFGSHGSEAKEAAYSVGFAAATICTIIPVILYYFAQKYIAKGLTFGAVKG
jgi:ABC-type glycerol-3-phosphate transport system permease component